MQHRRRWLVFVDPFDCLFTGAAICRSSRDGICPGFVAVSVQTAFGFALFPKATLCSLVFCQQLLTFPFVGMSFATSLCGIGALSRKKRHAGVVALLKFGGGRGMIVDAVFAVASGTVETHFLDLVRPFSTLQGHSLVLVHVVLAARHFAGWLIACEKERKKAKIVVRKSLPCLVLAGWNKLIDATRMNSATR